MVNFLSKIIFFTSLCIFGIFQSQFRNRDRMDKMEGFDNQKFSYGFFLAANYYDYKIVLNPHYGVLDNKNLITSKGTSSFGAGLIGRMRIDDNFDVRLEPGLEFVQREITFNTQSNDQYAAGNFRNPPFTPIVLTEQDKVRNVKSTYIDIPILLEFHGDRWYNSRPYAAAGFNYLINLQSNQKSLDDNQQGVYRTTTHNFGWSVEAGIQIYFSRFKFTPGIRGTFFINNELVSDNAGTPPYWNAGISTIQSRAVMLVLKFE